MDTMYDVVYIYIFHEDESVAASIAAAGAREIRLHDSIPFHSIRRHTKKRKESEKQQHDTHFIHHISEDIITTARFAIYLLSASSYSSW